MNANSVSEPFYLACVKIKPDYIEYEYRFKLSFVFRIATIEI